MTSHEVNVLGLTERSGDHFTRRPASTIGLIEVKPPISVGEKFGAVILGREQHGVSLSEVGSTADSTVLYAEAGSFQTDEASRQAQIQTIAERVLAFSNNPETSVELMQGNPFPQPQERFGR